MIRQRRRGVLGTTIAVCIPWIALGLLTGVVFQLDFIPGVHFGLGRPIPGGFVTVCTLAGAFVGVINGLTFSGVVFATERGKNVEELPARRFAMWAPWPPLDRSVSFLRVHWLQALAPWLAPSVGSPALWMARRPRVSAASAPSTPERGHASIGAPSA